MPQRRYPCVTVGTWRTSRADHGSNSRVAQQQPQRQPTRRQRRRSAGESSPNSCAEWLNAVMRRPAFVDYLGYAFRGLQCDIGEPWMSRLQVAWGVTPEHCHYPRHRVFPPCSDFCHAGCASSPLRPQLSPTTKSTTWAPTRSLRRGYRKGSSPNTSSATAPSFRGRSGATGCMSPLNTTARLLQP